MMPLVCTHCNIEKVSLFLSFMPASVVTGVLGGNHSDEDEIEYL